MKYFAILLFAIAAFASAQSFDPVATGVIGQQVTTTINPENPRPGENVTITLNAYGTNLNTATISWSVNGKQQQSGQGLNSFTLAAGKMGETKTVVATITSSTGPSFSRSFTVVPQDVAIIYESDGYVPPFYKGKGYYTPEGSVTLVALPNLVSSSGTRLNPNNLVYTWSVDDTIQGSMSGYGKNSFKYTGSILSKDIMIKVTVSTPDKTTTGTAAIILSPLQPEVLTYEAHPLYGTLFNKEITTSNFFLTDREVTVSAFPFSTSATKANDTNLVYNWTLNGTSIATPPTQNFATFRNTSGQKGDSQIGISIENTSHLLHSMKKTFNITF